MVWSAIWVVGHVRFVRLHCFLTLDLFLRHLITGHGVGCDFVTSPCLVGGGNGRDDSLPSYSKVNGLGVGCWGYSFLANRKIPSHIPCTFAFRVAPHFFCNKASSRGCSPSYTHKMACTVIDYSLKGDYLPPVQFQ